MQEKQKALKLLKDYFRAYSLNKAYTHNGNYILTKKLSKEIEIWDQLLKLNYNELGDKVKIALIGGLPHGSEYAVQQGYCDYNGNIFYISEVEKSINDVPAEVIAANLYEKMVRSERPIAEVQEYIYQKAIPLIREIEEATNRHESKMDFGGAY